MKRGLIVAALFALGAAFPARADQLSDLVDKYVAWRGGASYLALQSVHETAALETGGLNGKVESWNDRAGHSRADVDLGVIKESEAYTPDGGWSRTPSGQVEGASDVGREEARRAALLEFGGALRGEGGAKAALHGIEQRDGKSWQVVRVSFGGADTYDVFLDPATGELGGVRAYENRRTRYQRFSDWRMVDGVRMPFLAQTEAQIAAQNSTSRTTAIELNVKLEPKLFERPADVQKAVFAGRARSTGWVPFEFFDRNRIYIPAKVAGHETQVLLDSGAETTFIDKAFAEKIGLKPQGGVAAVGTGGTDKAGLVNGVDIQIGSLTLKDLTVAVMDLSSISKRLGHPLPVILGKEVFNQLVVDIDFSGARIAFNDPAGFKPPAGAVEVPVRLVDGLRSVPVSIEGRAPVQFDFDLGNGSPLAVFPAYWEPEKLLDGRRQTKTLGGAIGGVHPEALATVKRLDFAGVTFHDVPTRFTSKGTSAFDSEHTLGNVGLPILSRFRLTTDYAHDRIFLAPDAQTLQAPFPKEHLGLSVTPAADGFTVEYVSPGGPAEAAGLKAGDKVTRIDRKPAETWPSDALRGLRYEAVGRVVEFTLSTGEVKRVKLAEYY